MTRPVLHRTTFRKKRAKIALPASITVDTVEEDPALLCYYFDSMVN